MVRLIKYKDKYRFTVPIAKVKRKGWNGGEDFDVEFNQDGNIVFVEIKE